MRRRSGAREAGAMGTNDATGAMRSRSAACLWLIPALATALSACSGGREATTTITAALTVPLPPVTQFVILASRSASFGDRTTVSGGHIGVAAGGGSTPNTLSAAVDTHIGVGEVLLAPRVNLGERVTTGEIGATTINALPSDMTGPRSAYVAPPAQPAPGAIAPGTAPVTVAGGQTVTLAAGARGAVNVSGTLNLSGGLYQFQSLSLNNDARVVALAASTIRVASTVTGLDRIHLIPSGALPASALRLIVGGTTNAVTLGNDPQVTALVVASGDFKAGDRLILSGSIAGRDVVCGHDCVIGFGSGFGCGSNASCNDSSDCTTDTCLDAGCTHAALANGTTCNDGNACTQTDKCQAGVCVGSNPITCAAPDQCHTAGSCSAATGTCVYPNKPNGTTCNDNSLCTQGDNCQAGACVGATTVVCHPLDQCHDLGLCDPKTGVCSNPFKLINTPCDDGDKCTQDDRCVLGQCIGSNPNNCGACFLGDSDGDGVDDCHDVCNHNSLKVTPGICGCDVADTDTDHDGVPDCQDECPNDPTSQHKGQCGCADSPAPAGTPCDDGICRGASTCDGKGLCIGFGLCAPQPQCVQKFFEGKYYWLCPGPVSWGTAISSCRDLQASLAQIDSAAENQFIAQNLAGGATAWVGGNDSSTSGEWRWATAASNDGDRFWTGGAAGQPYFARFNAWSGGAPADGGASCTTISAAGLWTSVGCTANAGFVCEVPTARTVGDVTRPLGPPHKFGQVTGFPTTPPQPISQCNATVAQVFGTMTGDQAIAAIDLCNQTCKAPGDPGCATNCQGALAVPTGNNCDSLPSGSIGFCQVTATASPPQPCTTTADCPANTVCGQVTGCPDAVGGNCPPDPSGASHYCGTPSPGCPLATDAPDTLCGQTFLCDPVEAPQTVTGFDPGASDLGSTPFDPETTFPPPQQAPVADPFPDESQPCSGACGFPRGDPAQPNQASHPWCQLVSPDSLPPRDPQAPNKHGDSGGSLVSFNFAPNFRLDHTMTLGPLGVPKISLGAQAGVSAGVHIGSKLTPGSPNGADIQLLDAQASFSGSECEFGSDATLEVLGVDFIPLVKKASGGAFPKTIDAAPGGASQCAAAFNLLHSAGDRAKKAMLDALDLLRQREFLLSQGKNFAQATFCHETGADFPPRDFPPGDCANDPPEKTINRFIEYYKRSIVGFPIGAATAGVSEAVKFLKQQIGQDFNAIPFPLYSFSKDEEETIFDATFPIGPIPVDIELLATLSYGADLGLTLDYRPATIIDNILRLSDAQPVQDLAKVSVQGTPHAGAGLGLFAGVGFGIDDIEAKIGIEGDVNLGTVYVPAFAGAGIGLGSEPDKRAPPSNMTDFVTAANLIPPKRYVVDLSYTAGLSADVRDIVSGTVNGVLKLKFFFFSKVFKQQIFAFSGFCPSVSGETIPNDPPRSGCDFTLVSAGGSTDAASGSFPWGSLRMELPFPEIKPLDTTNLVAGSANVDTSQVQSYFYDSQCTCIHAGAAQPGCFRSADCCPETPVCATNDDNSTGCVQCIDSGNKCKTDGECCKGTVCLLDTGRCGIRGCGGPCQRDAECSAGNFCDSNNLCNDGSDCVK